MNYYTAYGLTIGSEIPLAYLSEVGPTDPDLTIRGWSDQGQSVQLRYLYTNDQSSPVIDSVFVPAGY